MVRRSAITGPAPAIASAVAVDGFSVFFMVAIGIAVVLGALLADGYLRRERLEGPEFYVLMLLSASGGMLMAAANDLIVVFLGLEILSIALYVLAGYHRRRAESGEAAMKYFVLGAFSSALFLYGIALVYGATGSTNLAEIAAFLANNVIVPTACCWPAWPCCSSAWASRWRRCRSTPGRPTSTRAPPTPVTGFMAAAAKAAGFAGLLRVFFSTFGVLRLDWQPIVWVIAVLTLLVGSVLALVQTDIKRMLAYSSISHAGYVLIGLQAGSSQGVAGSLFYLLAYTFMVLGSFAIVTVVGRRGDAAHDLDAYRGLATRRPGLALAFTVFLMAQAGVPFTTGFLAKFYVISAAVSAPAPTRWPSSPCWPPSSPPSSTSGSSCSCRARHGRAPPCSPGPFGPAFDITLPFPLFIGVAPSPSSPSPAAPPSCSERTPRCGVPVPLSQEATHP